MSSIIAQHPMIQLFRVTLPQLLFFSLPDRRGGRFRVQATGFLASDPADESRPMKATGTFTATRE